MKKRTILIILIIIIFEAVIFGLYFYFKKVQAQPVITKKLYFQTVPDNPESNLVSGAVPHHLAAKSLITEFFTAVAKQGAPQTIVLLGPDHFQAGILKQKQALVTLSPGTEKFFNLDVDKELLAALDQEKNIIFDTSPISLDHGITNLLPFIQKYLPKTKILPVIIPMEFTAADLKLVIKKISQSNEQIMIIASTDFSHYLPPEAAKFHDVKSVRTLINFEEPELSQTEVDCWQCLEGARYYAKLKKEENYEIIGANNAADFLPAVSAEQTTSYFSIIFGQNLKTNDKAMGQTILFVGDIMLDRGVADLMKKNSVYYPFEKIQRFLSGTDLAVGNLEGPIVKKPENFGDHAMTFNFSDEILPALAQNFNILNLANNHILNRGNQGLAETREFLEQSKINYFGDPVKCAEEFSYQKDNFIFLGINKTLTSTCPESEIVKTIKALKAANPDKLIIVNIHWGSEYQKKNSSTQQNLGHLMIESGADLIIGHHPHVVQNIELYKNKLIFYSLGNFIFDQYFSKNVQQGLAVGLEFYPDKLICHLFPLQSSSSQPELMPAKEASAFLEKLVDDSSESLKAGIKEGIIEIK